MAKMPIPSDWDGQTFCCYLVTWPKSLEWNGILTGFITTPTRGRFWDENTGSVVQAIGVGQQIEQLTLGNCNYMTCLDDLVQILQQSGGCGCGGGSGGADCGSGGQGSSEPPPNTTPTIENPGAAPPVGFSSWDEYRTYKCQAAQLIIDDIQTDLDLYSNLNLVGQTVTGVAIGIAPLMVTPAGFVTIVAIGSVLLAVLALGGTVLSAIKNFVINNESDLLCAIYEGTTVQGSIDNWNQTVNDLADQQEPSFPNNFYIKSLLSTMATNASFNRLIERETVRPLPAADCSECAGCTITFGFETTEDGFTFVDNSDSGAQAIGTYDGVAEALQTQLIVNPASGSTTATGTWSRDLTGLLPVVTLGDQVIVTIGATAGTGGNMLVRTKVVYTDATEEFVDSVGSAARTSTLVLQDDGKTIDRVELQIAKSTGAPTTFDVENDIFSVGFVMSLGCP